MGVTPLLSFKQVARRLGVCARTVWRMVRSGRLPPPLHPGPHCTRWRPEDIEGAIAGRGAFPREV